MRKLVYVIIGLLIYSTGWTQQRTINGAVTDNSNAPVAGASVTVKGTPIGTQTDASGNFQITVPAGSKILIISSVGFASQELSIEGKNQVSVSMKPFDNNLDQVVVV